ncbi:heme-binding protein 2-like [Mizuhopecten yessoensis]|uniref:Heme-binding protein 2 n=1 Tax=Mizuhopecten yessoensis TaxID=6573 RepID=A0A210QYJ5_MIZYE|nr:heme-binding protein 2-like [Mizuhopecten yessoensis]XP_021346498.1 heme-binding protein 2-like [Mizuhopecten yessoensis]OWF53804.1 Heme-binding protein 2 [Mizuhopecten yessoensis]
MRCLVYLTYCVAVSCALAVVQPLPNVQQAAPPAFCHDQECPKYSVTQSFTGYELRHYEESVWVATNLTTMEFTQNDSSEMFFKLFHYISGNNSKHVKIPMTTPVILKVEHGPGPTCESFFYDHFMVPFEFQDDPPVPTDPSVYITVLPPFDVYVKSFGGRPSFDEKMAMIESLVTEIADPSRFEERFYYFAGYDGPYTINHRHNEVWLVARH